MASKNDTGEEIAEVPTLEAALAMVGGNPSGGDACCVFELNNGSRQFREGQNNSEENSRDPNSSSSEHHQEEPRPATEPVIRIPRRRSSRRRRRTTLQFTLWQVEEMEKMFKETQYPHELARKELTQALNIPDVKVKTWFVHRRAEERKSERRVLARSMSVPEAKVQTWFNNRRAKQRASEKKAMLRSAPPGIQDHISMKDVEEP